MQIMDDREGMTLGEEGLRRWPQVSVIVMLSQQPRLEEVLGQVQTVTPDMLNTVIEERLNESWGNAVVSAL